MGAASQADRKRRAGPLTVVASGQNGFKMREKKWAGNLPVN